MIQEIVYMKNETCYCHQKVHKVILLFSKHQKGSVHMKTAPRYEVGNRLKHLQCTVRSPWQVRIKHDSL